jgi:hypothetical protein
MSGMSCHQGRRGLAVGARATFDVRLDRQRVLELFVEAATLHAIDVSNEKIFEAFSTGFGVAYRF